MRYVVTCEDKATGAVADTYKTFVGVKAANTTGYRLRLRSLFVGPTVDSPVDRNVGVKVARTNNAADGTGTAQTPEPKSNQLRASVMTAKVDYSAEPTTYDTPPLWAAGMNLRGAILKEWAPEDAPCVGPNETLGVLIAPRSANAERLTVAVEYEEY